MNLRISPELELSLDAARRVFSFLAIRGAGKTWAAAVLAEEMVKAGIPIIVLDPMGVWWGLRVGFDGKGKGLPVVVFGGEHGDLPLEPEKAEKLADALIQSNVSAVVDISELSHAAVQKFIPLFLDELRRTNTNDRHIFLEEADVIAPQHPMKNETVCLGAVDNFVRRGGNRNLGCSLISQRSAVINKNVLTQSDFLVVLRTNAPQDKAAVAAWAVNRMSDKKTLDKWLDSLSNLKDGEAYVWGPDMNVPGVRTKFRVRETFHATRENLKRFDASKIHPMDVGEFIARFRDVFEGRKPREKKPELQQLLDEHARHKDQGLGSEFQKIHDKVEDEMDGARPPHDASLMEGEQTPNSADRPNRVAKSPPAPPQTATTTLAAFTLQVTKLESDSFIGKVVYVLNRLNRAVYPKDIGASFVEQGWPFSAKNFASNVAPYIREGLMVKEENGMYRLPTEVKVEEVVAA